MSYKRPKTQNNFQSLTIAGQVLDKIVLFQWLVMVIWRGEDVQSSQQTLGLTAAQTVPLFYWIQHLGVLSLEMNLILTLFLKYSGGSLKCNRDTKTRTKMGNFHKNRS